MDDLRGAVEVFLVAGGWCFGLPLGHVFVIFAVAETKLGGAILTLFGGFYGNTNTQVDLL